MSVSAVARSWLTAAIVPVFKKGDSAEVSNYRPISLTSVGSKIMERVIVKQMTSFFVEHDFISPAQHGFISGRSTWECFNDWTVALQDRNGVDIVYIDFAKAFDSVSYAKLIHRLRNYCIDGPLLLWISTFLCDRSHCTRVGNTDSAAVSLISGVIQGSGIGRCCLCSLTSLLKPCGHSELLLNYSQTT